MVGLAERAWGRARRSNCSKGTWEVRKAGERCCHLLHVTSRVASHPRPGSVVYTTVVRFGLGPFRYDLRLPLGCCVLLLAGTEYSTGSLVPDANLQLHRPDHSTLIPVSRTRSNVKIQK